jgi:hypothetical protein
VESITAKRVQEEPSITNRFLQEMEHNINNIAQKNGIQFFASTLTSFGPNTQESQIGADFLGTLNIQIPGLSLTKGFLCQSKRSGNGIFINQITQRNISVQFTQKAILLSLQNQTEKMLNRSPDSYVSIYSQEGFAFIPAISVQGLTFMNNDTEIYAKNTRLFFNEFLMCFIGDRKLNSIDDSSLRILAEQTATRYAFRIDLKSI